MRGIQSSKGVWVFGAAAIAAFGIWLAAACANPLSPPKAPSSNGDRSTGGAVYITAFNVYIKGDNAHPRRKVNMGGTEIGPNTIGGTVMQRDIADGRDAMHPDEPAGKPSDVVIGGKDGYAALVPEVKATSGAYVLPLTQRYIDYAFSDSSVRAAAYDWAVRLKTEPEGNGLTSQYILTLIEEQNKKTKEDLDKGNPGGLYYFRAPIAEADGSVGLEYAVDFSSAIDIVVLSAQGKDTRRYKVTMTPPTSTPLYVNALTGNDNNTGLNWTDAFQTLERALIEPNRNSNLRLPKEILLAGDISGGGRPVYYDLKGFIFAKGASGAIVEANQIDTTTANTPALQEEAMAKLVPPEGGISIIGGFQGIETAQGENPNNPDQWPTFVYNSSPEADAGSAIENGGIGVPATLSVYGVPFELTNVTLTAAEAPGTTLTDVSDSGLPGPGGNLAVFVGKEVSGAPAQGKLILNTRGRVTGGDTTGSTDGKGGGVHVTDGGVLQLIGGEILSNKAKIGGGVYVDFGTISMTSGKIAGNEAAGAGGGGVYIDGKDQYHVGVMNFTAGLITGNLASDNNHGTAAGNGGGVYVKGNGPSSTQRGSFFMGIGSSSLAAGMRPEISGNIAMTYGGGVYYTMGAVVKKDADSAGQPSGLITALDDAFPPLDRDTGLPYASVTPQSTSNVAFYGTDFSTYPPSQAAITVLARDNGPAIFSRLGPEQDSFGAFRSHDSNTSGGGGGSDGSIYNFLVSYKADGDRDLTVSVIHEKDFGTSSYTPGKITVWVPAEAIDNYSDEHGNPVADNLSTEITVNSTALLLQMPYDFLSTTSLVTLLPTKADTVAAAVRSYYNEAMPVNTTRDVVGKAKSIQDFLTQRIADDTPDVVGARSVYDALRSSHGGGDHANIKNGPAADTVPLPINFGLAPWYVIIDQSNGAHVYYTEVILESGAPLKVTKQDGSVYSGTRDGKSWVSAFETLQAAIDKAPAYVPTEIWVAGESWTTEEIRGITGNKRITIIGGFKGNELTKKQRGAVDVNSPCLTIGFTLANNAISGGAQLGVEYFLVNGTNDFVLPSGSSLTLGEGVKVDGIGVVATNSSVTLNANALLNGTAGKTGVAISGGTLTMNGTSQITNYATDASNKGGGGAVLSGASLIMNDSAKILQNTVIHSSGVSVLPTITGSGLSPVAGGVTLINSSSLILNDVQDPDNNTAYPTPPQILSNTTQIERSDAKAPGGGGVYAKNSTITFVASEGSIGITQVGAGGRINNNRVMGTISGNGGGVYLDAGARLVFHKGEINLNSVQGSSADGRCDGGGVYLGGSNDTGPGKFVNRSEDDAITAIQAVNQGYNNGVQLDMTPNSSLVGGINLLDSSATDRAKQPIIAGNFAQKRGGGVFISAGAELYKYSGGRATINKTGVIFGNSFSRDSSLVNSANAGGAALYDMNAVKTQQDSLNKGLFIRAVDVTVWGNGETGVGVADTYNWGNYPPDLNGDDTDTTLRASAYYKENAPNRNSTIALFQMTKEVNGQVQIYNGTITNYDSTGYMHRGEDMADNQAMASGEIKIRLPLSDVQRGGTPEEKAFQMIIEPGGNSTVAAANDPQFGAKILLPLAMYNNAGNAISTVFRGPKTFVDGHDTDPPSDAGLYKNTPSAGITTINLMQTLAASVVSPISADNPVFPAGALASVFTVADTGITADDKNKLGWGLKGIQWQADNPELPINYGRPGVDLVYSAYGASSPVALFAPAKFYNGSPYNGKTNLNLMSADATATPPRFIFAETARQNTYYLYCISESGNIRMYRLVVDVYTAVPKYVNTAGASGDPWGQDMGTNLTTALEGAMTATTSVDIWVKGNGATGWTDTGTGPREFSGAPVTITGGFLGNEVAPEARPSYPGEAATIYAHEYDTTTYTKATYNSPGDGTVKTYTKGPNHTKITMARDTVVSTGTVLTFRDIDVAFNDNNLVIDGGQVVLENAWFSFANGKITLQNGGMLTIQDADYQKAHRESKIEFGGTGSIIVGTTTPAAGTTTDGTGRLSLYSGIIKFTGGADITENGLITIGRYVDSDTGSGAYYNTGMVTSGSELTLSAATAHVGRKYEAEAGAIIDARSSYYKPVVAVKETTRFIMNGGVINGNGSGTGTGSESTGVQVSGSKALISVDTAKQVPSPQYGSFTMKRGEIKGFGGTSGTGVTVQVHGVFTKEANATIYGASDRASPNVYGNSIAISDGTLEGKASNLSPPNDKPVFEVISNSSIRRTTTNGKANWNQTFGQGTTFNTLQKAKFALLAKFNTLSRTADYAAFPDGNAMYIYIPLKSSSSGYNPMFTTSLTPNYFKTFGQTGVNIDIGGSAVALDDTKLQEKYRAAVVKTDNRLLADNELNVVIEGNAFDKQDENTYVDGSGLYAYGAFSGAFTPVLEDSYILVNTATGTTFADIGTFNDADYLLRGYSDGTVIKTAVGGSGLNKSARLAADEIVLKTSDLFPGTTPAYLLIKASKLLTGNTISTPKTYAGFVKTTVAAGDKYYLVSNGNATGSFSGTPAPGGNYEIHHAKPDGLAEIIPLTGTQLLIRDKDVELATAVATAAEDRFVLVKSGGYGIKPEYTAVITATPYAAMVRFDGSTSNPAALTANDTIFDVTLESNGILKTALANNMALVQATPPTTTGVTTSGGTLVRLTDREFIWYSLTPPLTANSYILFIKAAAMTVPADADSASCGTYAQRVEVSGVTQGDEYLHVKTDGVFSSSLTGFKAVQFQTNGHVVTTVSNQTVISADNKRVKLQITAAPTTQNITLLAKDSVFSTNGNITAISYLKYEYGNGAIAAAANGPQIALGTNATIKTSLTGAEAVFVLQTDSGERAVQSSGQADGPIKGVPGATTTTTSQLIHVFVKKNIFTSVDNSLGLVSVF
jgi:hypothetical protein